MIGVYCANGEKKIVQEFFELFKTPWEFFDPLGNYDVIVSTQYETPATSAGLVIIYSSAPVLIDTTEGLATYPLKSKRLSNHNEILFPIYGALTGFGQPIEPLIFSDVESAAVAISIRRKDLIIIRVGFDLFREVAFLLSKGQPIENASFPTLESHISILRNWILSAGIAFVEIPPLPLGYNYFVCLTHDIDFVGIRRHRFDHTMWGFVYRSLVGTSLAFMARKASLGKLIRNWIAVLKLPFVYLGLAEDFWGRFDKYSNIDNGYGSTFFLIPFKNRAGDILRSDKTDHHRRAAPYGVNEITGQVKNLLKLGHEVGLHGIDAWNSIEKGEKEMAQVAEIAGEEEIGVRMHWLYYDGKSPAILENIGFDYDATLGYNETIGFRNGTMQVFRPFEVKRLLEIPLTVQDTALFYPRRLALGDLEANRLCQNLLKAADFYGGVLTLSWHDRSLEPERLWGDFYHWLLQEIRLRGAWIGSAHQIVKWFRRRRSVSFLEFSKIEDVLKLKINLEPSNSEPNMFCRFYIPSESDNAPASKKKHRQIDIPLTGEKIIELNFRTSEVN